MTDPAGTYRELAERYGLDIETIGGGAQMLSLYFASGTGVHVTCLEGGGLPTSDNWHIGVHPADWDGDGGSLLFERRSDDGSARSFHDTIDAALWTAEYGRRSIGALTEEYAAFLKEEGLPELSADELLHEDLTPISAAMSAPFWSAGRMPKAWRKTRSPRRRTTSPQEGGLP